MPDKATQELDTGVEIPNVNDLSKEELEHVAASTPEQLAAELTAPEEEEISGGEAAPEDQAAPEEKQTTVLKGKSKPQSKTSPSEAIEVVLDDGRKIVFDNKDQLLQNFKSLRISLDKFNAERGTTYKELQRMRDLEQQYTALQRELEDLKRVPAHPPKGQQAAATTDMVHKAEEAGIDPKEFFKDLTPENFAEKMAEILDTAAMQAEKRLSPRLQAAEDENKKLREEFGQIRTDMTYREQKSVFDSHYLNLMNEITQLQAKVPAIKTQWTPEQINAAIQQYGSEQAQLVVPPGDFDKWTIIESMLKEDYCPIDSQGRIDITQRKLKSINSAWAAFQVEHPELNDQTVAAAHTQGQQQVLEQVQRVTNRPPTLPNNLSTADTNPDAMTIEQAQKWISTPPETLAIWKRTKDPRYQKFEEAQAFAEKYAG
jgi:hypothetical protein